MTSTIGQWADGGAVAVAAGVHRIPLPMPNDGLQAVNVYAIADGDRLALIDGGWALQESRDALAAGLASIGRGIDDISRILVTHVHRDHFTQAVTLRRECRAPISLGGGERGTLELIIEAGLQGFVGQLEQLRRCGADDVADRLAELTPRVAGEPTDWEMPDYWLDGDVDIRLADRTLRAIPTPGHTRGHYVFLDRAARLLFSGDHVLPHITPSIGLEAVPARRPLADYLGSLELLLTMPDAALLPAHGPVTDSVHARVRELLQHHASRLEECRAVVEAGARTARQAAGRLGWTRRGRHFDDLDVFNQMLAVMETAAHLDVLCDRGLLQVLDSPTTRGYRPPGSTDVAR